MSWTISESTDLQDIIDFLIIDEWKHVQALSLFYSQKTLTYPNKSIVISVIKKNNNKVSGGVFISNKGLIYPVFIKPNQNDKNQLIQLLASINVKVHGVIGLKADVDFLDSVLFRRIKAKNNYLIMDHEANTTLTSQHNLEIKKATVKDLTRLLPMEIEYQIEEVLLNSLDLNKKAVEFNLKKKLLTDDIYYLSMNKFPVSKAGTTYKSKNYILLGGIFTWKEKRNMGYSTLLLQYLLNEQMKDGYKAALFVKDNNSSALHLYKKLGFKTPLQYNINYYYI